MKMKQTSVGRVVKDSGNENERYGMKRLGVKVIFLETKNKLQVVYRV